MSGAAESESSSGGAPAAPKPRPTTPKQDSVAAVATQEARNAANTSTPRRQRTNGKLTPITVLREEIAPQMDGEFMECSIERFIEHYLPFEPKDEDVNKFIESATYKTESAAEAPVPSAVDAVRPSRATARATTAPLSKPRPGQVLEESEDGELRFIDYPGVIPTTSGETQSYSYLRKIMDAIGNAEVNGRSRNGYQYRACPDKVVESEIPGSDNKIDGCIIAGNAISPKGDLDLRTTTVAVAFEFMLKSNKKPESDNNLQAVSANVQIMNDDVRRMFSYGVTIVEENVRLWYHGRSHSAVSEPFDFVKNPAVFIKVIMAFLYATEVELGYDDKVRRLTDNRLVFEMEDKNGNPVYYRTVRTLSEYRSNNITGRMSRVWEVEEVTTPDKDGRVVSRGVLKDVWLDNDALTERQVQEAIFSSIEARKAALSSDARVKGMTPTPQNEIIELVEKGSYRNYFLTIKDDFQGRISMAVAPGARRKRGLLVPEPRPKKPPTHQVNVSRTRTGTDQPTQLEQKIQAAQRAFVTREFRQKKQYRVVFEELCVTVGSLKVLGHVIDVLMQSLTALRLLYLAGWVHRDISSGNVMAYSTGAVGEPTEWKVKLCDLEYAKEYSLTPPEASQDPKTGTPYFMPHEILFGEALLPNNAFIPIQPTDPEDDSHVMAAMQAVVRKRKFTVPNLTVIPNFQHDLESIWWLTVYSVTARVAHPPSQQFALTIFQHTTELGHHRAVFLEREIEDRLTECLHPDLTSFAASLNMLRGHLLQEYRKRNRKRLMGDTLHDLESYVYIHNQFFLLFRAMKKLDANVLEFPLIEESSDGHTVPPPQPRKRPRSVRNYDDDDYVEEEHRESEEERDDEQPKKKRKPVGNGGVKTPTTK